MNDKIFNDFHYIIDLINNMKFLGSTKITGRGSIRLIKDVADILDAKEGDHILFYEEDEKIFIKKG